MHCNTEDECTQLTKSLPPTEAALLDWAINLMADVVMYDQINKMNARNIAMVFAPNMTQVYYLHFLLDFYNLDIQRNDFSTPKSHSMFSIFVKEFEMHTHSLQILNRLI